MLCELQVRTSDHLDAVMLLAMSRHVPTAKGRRVLMAPVSLLEGDHRELNSAAPVTMTSAVSLYERDYAGRSCTARNPSWIAEWPGRVCSTAGAVAL